MRRNFVSIVSTVYNEESTIKGFLNSLISQSVKPDEIIIVDGGSSDKTVQVLQKYKKNFLQKIPFRVLIKKGNRSIGRNYGIEIAKGDIVLLSDAGCILDKHWVKNMTMCFSNKNTQVVAGYYKAKAETLFQKCLVPYALVMPDRVNPSSFLPSTRSMAMKKSVWKEIGGFPEQFSHNEDYVFAKILLKRKIQISFCKNAFVYWIPRRNIKDAFIMFFRFSFGDAEAKIFRPKVLLIFLRYFAFLLIFFVAVFATDNDIWFFLLTVIFFYLLWSILKNFKYVRKVRAIFILPLIQMIADGAIILGTSVGLLRSLLSR